MSVEQSQNFDFEEVHFIDKKTGKIWGERKKVKDCSPEELAQANLRTKRKGEIIFDLEEPERLDALIEQLKTINVSKAAVWKTGSRGYHVHAIIPNLVSMQPLEARAWAQVFIQAVNCDVAMAKERQLVAMENKPHFKTGNLKTWVKTIGDHTDTNGLPMWLRIRARDTLKKLKESSDGCEWGQLPKLEAVCKKHGLVPNGADKILCPWHDDHDPSLKLYDDGVYCFSCRVKKDWLQLDQQLAIKHKPVVIEQATQSIFDLNTMSEAQVHEIFHAEKDKMLVKSELAKALRKKYPCVVGANGRLHRYVDGVYEDNAEDFYKGQILRLIGRGASISAEKEILHFIKAEIHAETNGVPTLGNSEVHLLPVQNGVLNLQTRQLLPHSEKNLFFQKLDVKYDPNADCPVVKKYLSEVVSPEDRQILEEWAGYCLWREYSIPKMLILVGPSGCGKSKYLTLMDKMLGSRNVTAQSFEALGSEEDRFCTAQLHNKMLNSCAELPRATQKEVSRMLKLCGKDMISGQHKHQPGFDFVSYAKLLWSTNDLPELQRLSDEFVDRLLIVDFPTRFRGTEREIPDLDKKMTTKTELSGFLNLALDGLKRLFNHEMVPQRFSHSLSMDETREKYTLRSLDGVGKFVSEMVDFDPKAKAVKMPVVYREYQKFCGEEGLTADGYDAFFRKLWNNHTARKHGVNKSRPTISGRREWCVTGIKLKSIVFDDEMIDVEEFEHEEIG